MENLIKLEHVLDSLDYLADTFYAIDLANQNQAFALPEFALTLPTEMMKTYTKEARGICREMLKKDASTTN